MANVNEPELLDEVLPVDAGKLPEQPTFETLQPGNGYTFVLPDAENIAKHIDVIQTERGQRIQANLLLKVPGKSSIFGKISNKEYTVGKDKVLVSDLAYLLSALGAVVSGGNKSYKDALVAHAGQSFVADYEWTAYCNPKNAIYDEAGNEVEGTGGCGAQYALRSYTRKKDQVVVNAIPKDEDGKYAERFLCAGKTPSGDDCPAIVRAFGQVRRIRAK